MMILWTNGPLIKGWTCRWGCENDATTFFSGIYGDLIPNGSIEEMKSTVCFASSDSRGWLVQQRPKTGSGPLSVIGLARGGHRASCELDSLAEQVELAQPHIRRLRS
jgi:hypothetical protein